MLPEVIGQPVQKDMGRPVVRHQMIPGIRSGKPPRQGLPPVRDVELHPRTRKRGGRAERIAVDDHDLPEGELPRRFRAEEPSDVPRVKGRTSDDEEDGDMGRGRGLLRPAYFFEASTFSTRALKSAARARPRSVSFATHSVLTRRFGL